jgi:hypothetical protein
MEVYGRSSGNPEQNREKVGLWGRAHGMSVQITTQQLVYNKMGEDFSNRMNVCSNQIMQNPF